MSMFGLTAAHSRAFVDLMGSSCQVAVSAQVMTKDHRYVSPPMRLTAAQVTVDTTALVDRTAELTIWDPEHRTGLRDADPSGGSLYLDRMVRVRYGWLMPWGWVSIPVFTGPVVWAGRDAAGPELAVQCHGKEALMRPPYSIVRPVTIPRGTRLHVIVRRVAQAFGEAWLSLPVTSPVIAQPVTVNDNVDAWQVLKDLASKAGYRLWYDARGVLTLDRLPSRSRYTFRGGNGGTVLSPPDVTTDLNEVRNAVHVLGATPDGATNPLSAWAFVTGPEWATPWGARRNATRQYLVDRIEDSTLDTKAKVVARATAAARWAVDAKVAVEFDSIAVPWLDPLDQVTLSVSPFHQQFRLRRATWQLTPGASSVGYIRPPRSR